MLSIRTRVLTLTQVWAVLGASQRAVNVTKTPQLICNLIETITFLLFSEKKTCILVLQNSDNIC